MTEKPILFSAPMVRALLAGRKTQTRRVAKVERIDEHPQHAGLQIATMRNGQQYWLNCQEDHPSHITKACPYGQPGDRLWVREAWAETKLAQVPDASMAVYREGDNRTDYGGPWKPGIHMPRWASRITLEVTGVRVERLQGISEADAVAEGIRISISSQARRSDACYGIYECLMPDGKTHFNDSAYDLYRTLWEQINGAGSWEANPWVWAVSFRRITP